MELQPIIDCFAKIKHQDLPGYSSHKKMEPSIRQKLVTKEDKQTRKSAVLIIFYNVGGQLKVLYIKRPEYNGVHSGQVAFPGGKFDIELDENLEDTVLRECFEEIGIPKDKINLLGQLTPIHIPVSKMDVTPFVGVLTGEPKFKCNEEVRYLIEIPVDFLFDKKYRKSKIVTYDNITFEMPYFNFLDEEVWGATAMITIELIDLLYHYYPFK